MDLFSLVAKLALDASGYEKGIADAESKGKGLASKLSSGMATAGKVVAGAVAAVGAAAGAMAATVSKEVGNLAAYGDNIDKASQKLGISAKAYQEWDAVLQHSGASIDSLGTGMKTLATKAQSGSEAFTKLGISQEKAAKMSREDLFSETVTALQNVQDENQRSALAMELFGKSAMELGPLLNTSAAETQAMKDRVHELGGVMSDEAVKAAAAYQDSLQDMQTAIDDTKRSLLQGFLPAFTTVMDGISDLLTSGGEKGGDKLTEGLNKGVEQINSVLPKIISIGSKLVLALADAIVQNLPMLIEVATEGILALVTGLVNQLPMLARAGVQIIVTLAHALADSLPELIPTIVEVVVQIAEVLTEPSTLVNLTEAALTLMIALAEGLINALPELIAAVPQIILNLVMAFLGNLAMLVSAGSSLMGALADGIANNLAAPIKGILRVGEAISEAIGDIVQGAWEWGKDLILNFWDGLMAFINKPIEAIQGLAGKIKRFLGFSEPEEGPLSNFHTYAPDMMKLFAEGIEDNRDMITDAIGDAFNVRTTIGQNIAASGGAGATEFSVPRGDGGQATTLILMLNDTELGRILLPYIEAEQRRVGVRLATGGAY